MNYSTFACFKAFLAILLISFGFSTYTYAQAQEPIRENASLRIKYKKAKAATTDNLQQNEVENTINAKDADFALTSFPLKGKNLLSVKSAIPNRTVKVLVYDITGKIIYNEKVPTGPAGEFELEIDPRVNFTYGDGFVAAIYGSQVFYETIPLGK
jgi:hypothetical protein